MKKTKWHTVFRCLLAVVFVAVTFLDAGGTGVITRADSEAENWSIQQKILLKIPVACIHWITY